MAGSEQSGYGVARADLFKGALVVLTPTSASDPRALKRVWGFWEALGARVTTLDPATHDRAVAAISHLPHLVADALVDAVLRMDPRLPRRGGRGLPGHHADRRLESRASGARSSRKTVRRSARRSGPSGGALDELDAAGRERGRRPTHRGASSDRIRAGSGERAGDESSRRPWSAGAEPA